MISKINGRETCNRYDGKGNHILFEENVSGAVDAEYTYDAWGNILTQSGSMASTNSYRYQVIAII